MLIDPLWSVSKLKQSHYYISTNVLKNAFNLRIKQLLHFIFGAIHSSVGQSSAKFLHRQLFVTIVVHAAECSKNQLKVNEHIMGTYVFKTSTCPNQRFQMLRGPNTEGASCQLDFYVFRRPVLGDSYSSTPTLRDWLNWSDVVTSMEWLNVVSLFFFCAMRQL